MQVLQDVVIVFGVVGIGIAMAGAAYVLYALVHLPFYFLGYRKGNR